MKRDRLRVAVAGLGFGAKFVAIHSTVHLVDSRIEDLFREETVMLDLCTPASIEKWVSSSDPC